MACVSEELPDIEIPCKHPKGVVFTKFQCTVLDVKDAESSFSFKIKETGQEVWVYHKRKEWPVDGDRVEVDFENRTLTLINHKN